MSDAAEGAIPFQGAWQPFTFGGLAAFARARVGWLLLAELVTSIVVGGCVVWFLHRDWSPAIVQIIQQMPESAEITQGRLRGFDETLIGETKFFAIAVTPISSDQIGQSADVQIQFRPFDLRVGTVFRPDWGWEFDYGRDTALVLSRSRLEPWWGAWQPVLLTCAGVAVIVVLCTIWAVLATIYTVPAKCVAGLADKQLSWLGAWRLSSAAMLPGAFLFCLGLLCYGRQAIDLIGLASFYAAHLLITLVYIVGGAWACPKLFPKADKPNPFKS